jgi:hypothetical protein
VLKREPCCLILSLRSGPIFDLGANGAHAGHKFHESERSLGPIPTYELDRFMGCVRDGPTPKPGPVLGTGSGHNDKWHSAILECHLSLMPDWKLSPSTPVRPIRCRPKVGPQGRTLREIRRRRAFGRRVRLAPAQNIGARSRSPRAKPRGGKTVLGVEQHVWASFRQRRVLTLTKTENNRAERVSLVRKPFIDNS